MTLFFVSPCGKGVSYRKFHSVASEAKKIGVKDTGFLRCVSSAVKKGIVFVRTKVLMVIKQEYQRLLTIIQKLRELHWIGCRYRKRLVKHPYKLTRRMFHGGSRRVVRGWEYDPRWKYEQLLGWLMDNAASMVI